MSDGGPLQDSRLGSQLNAAEIRRRLGGARGRVQLIHQGTAFFSRGLVLYAWTPAQGIVRLAHFPATARDQVAAANHLGQRLMRSMIHHVVPLDDRRLVVFGPRRVAILDRQTRQWSAAHPIVGSRPLRVATHAGQTYYGEYRNNAERSPINVWQSVDREGWRPKRTFDAVRHIHGVFWDRFTETFWVTTGDYGEECGIWNAPPDFSELALVAGGGQQARAVDLVFTSDAVFFATDAPDVQNYIYRIDRGSTKPRQLGPVSGPVFYGASSGSDVLFSTVCEPTTVNDVGHARVYQVNAAGSEPKEMLALGKDAWPMKLFQYGQIWFPYSDGSLPGIWLSPLSTERSDTIMVLDADE